MNVTQINVTNSNS